MDERKRGLVGSPRRDAFKQWHKEECAGCYATDLDLTLVKKTEWKEDGKTIRASAVVAILDYKAFDERITFAEIIVYNDAIAKWNVPVYIVATNVKLEQCSACGLYHANRGESFTRFTVQRYWGGDWRPLPEQYELETIFVDEDETAYWAWERELRDSIEAENFHHPDVVRTGGPFDYSAYCERREATRDWNR